MVKKTYAQKRQEEIVKAARKVFLKKGFTDATMKDVMEEAGISRGGLYAYFPNIDELFIAVLEFDDSEDLFYINIEEANGLESLNSWLTVVLNGSQPQLTRAKSEFLFKFSAKEFPYLKNRREQLLTVLEAYFNKLQREKEISSLINTKLLADLLISWIDGMLIQENNYPSTQKDREEKAIIFIEMLQNYLRKEA